MSTPRFPRTKFVRALLRVEQELNGWAEYLRSENIKAGVALDRAGWDDRATAMYILALDVHSVADDMAGLPGAAQRRFLRATAVKRRAAMPRTSSGHVAVTADTIR